ncbi:FAD-binding oxidoreductase [Zunongwangia sp. SCSIO 43204]|uniref:NAD(P)/FAD-dependent oxidoreductase n=1 Tax=Zunongwangia sp. SCSIO 43204 TaxID=2779359 RepID=UPI001CA7FF57|nr:FAD-dependent oxidoreductase [Zunongwangia sp. SCSIO 43204]UAB85799.1 FAD-binding oxidoreductase [Zunongwangia sp. SCSIO 43204]
MLDYIVVGLGLSGIAISSQLQKRGRSFVVFEDNSQTSTKVAGGIYNPVILKRFTLAWEADKQISYSIPFYQKLEEELNEKLLRPFSIYRRFHSIEEQNNWFEAADNFRLSPFLNTQLIWQVNNAIPGDFSFGKVEKTGALDTELLVRSYKKYLEKHQILKNQRFEYSKLKISEEGVSYDGLEARNIIFCEGFGVVNNPYFNYLPLRGNKGEYLVIRSEELQLKQAVKSSIFILPLGNDLYKVGATYNHQDKTQAPTLAAKEKLKMDLDKMINCKYEIVDQVAGIRPATSDRRPLAGNHPEHQRFFICNGFGSRGVLIAPLISEKLLNFIEDEIPLPPEVDIRRFQKKFYRS